MASTRGFDFQIINFGGFPRAKRPQKPIVECGGQGCRKISAHMGNETPMSVSRQELRKLRPVWDFMADTYAKWTKNNVMALGAALAFYTTFSMAPLLILVIAIFGVIIDEATIQAEILKRMSELMGEQGATAIKVIIGAAYRPGTGLVATIIGILAIVIGSTSAFVMLKKALNIIWGVQPNHAAPL
jgi:uncharacterized BrkB/YihY/UPF0761 family membrane protein